MEKAILSVVFENSSWWLLAAGIGALIFACLLYLKSKDFPDKKRLAVLLGVLRFLSIATLGFLLVAPFIKTTKETLEPPKIIFAKDVSQSIEEGWNTDDEKSSFNRDFIKLQNEIGDQYEVVSYVFGDDVRNMDNQENEDAITNISEFLDFAEENHSHENIGAIVLASDGIFNEGKNPSYSKLNLKAPIHAIGLGDTSVRKDISIKNVYHNQIVYLGDRFEIQVDIKAHNFKDSQSRISIQKYQNGNWNSIDRQNVIINKSDFFGTYKFIIDSEFPGIERYRVVVIPLNGESEQSNNYKQIFIDVLDAKQKILILHSAPHPDISAVRKLIADNKNYEVKTSLLTDFKESILEFQFVIFHQLPSETGSFRGVLEEVMTNKIPHLWIVGNKTNISFFNQAQNLVEIKSFNTSSNQVTSSINRSFSTFTISDQLKDQIKIFPPLEVPFGEYTAFPSTSVLASQMIGEVSTKYPLIVFGEQDGVRVGAILGEGFWRWKLFDYLQNTDHRITDELISKSIQYLSIKEDKRKFKLILPKNIYRENEIVTVKAELYNDAFQRINDPEVKLEVYNEEGERFDFVFNRIDDSYILETGLWPAGDFTMVGKVNLKGLEMSHNAKFSIEPLELEMFDLTANHNDLKLLSDNHGGVFFWTK